MTQSYKIERSPEVPRISLVGPIEKSRSPLDYARELVGRCVSEEHLSSSAYLQQQTITSTIATLSGVLEGCPKQNFADIKQQLEEEHLQEKVTTIGSLALQASQAG